MKRYFLFLLIVIVAFLFSGCVKNYFDFDNMNTNVNWNPNVAAPVAKAHLRIRDILQDYDYNELFEEDSTHFLYLVYRKRVVSTPASDIITLPVQTIGESFTKTDVDNGGFSPNHIIKSWVSYPFNNSGTQLLDSIYLKNLDMTIHVKSTFQHTGVLVVTFPSITQNGVPFSATFNINTHTGTYDQTNNFGNFDGYTMDLTGLNGTDTNKIFVTYDLVLDDNGNPTVLPSQSCDIDISFNNMQYYALFGYLGQDTVSINRDTVHLDIFDHAFQGTAYFEDPHINIYVNNSYGLPLKFHFDNFTTYSVEPGSTPESYPFPLGDVDINYPLISELGQSKNTTITLDTSNFPQLRDMINNAPKYVFFKVDGIMNPDGYTGTNFALDTSHFYVDMEVNLPLWGYADYLVLEDTAEVGSDFSKNFHKGDIVNWVKFRLNVDNGMPAKVGVQVYFDDSLHNVLDSMFTSPQQMEIIPSAQVDANYKVIAPTHKTTDIYYDRDRINKLENVKYVRFRGYVRTTDFEHRQLVKFYSYYAIDIKLGMQVDATLNSNENYDF